MNNAFKKLVFIGLVISQVSLVSIPAEAGSLWQDIGTLMSHCTVRPFDYTLNHRKLYHSTQSTCHDVVVTANEVRFALNLAIYTASITESADSDGGDLYDVKLFNSDRVLISTRSNVLAYGDPLLALIDPLQAPNEVAGN